MTIQQLPHHTQWFYNAKLLLGTLSINSLVHYVALSIEKVTLSTQILCHLLFK